jgi:hypothetical protein
MLWAGVTLSQRDLDIDIYFPGLLGVKRGGVLGRKGGTSRSPAKRRASRRNGCRGGRPKKDSIAWRKLNLSLILVELAPDSGPTPLDAARGAASSIRILRLQEFQGLLHKFLMILENAPVSSVVIEYEFGIRKTAREVSRVAAGHHLVSSAFAGRDPGGLKSASDSG